MILPPRTLGCRLAGCATPIFAILTLLSVAAGTAHAQSATVTGQVLSDEDGQPLAFAAVTVVSAAIDRLASERGTFVLRGLPPGQVRLRIRRIGYAPKDTVLTVAANATAELLVRLDRLALRLPTIVVRGTCTDQTPRQPQPVELATLFDQVRENAARLRLLAEERPFRIQTVAIGEQRNPRSGAMEVVRVDTAERGALPAIPYVPRRVMRRGEGAYRGHWVVLLPELPDLADSAFTNNHCLWYAGQTRFGTDSVVQVDFEPVPWLAKDVDLEGSFFVRVDDYQLVGLITRLNRPPPQNRAIMGYEVRARFSEAVSGIPVLTEWELTNILRNGTPGFVQRGKVTRIHWLAEPPGSRDTVAPGHDRERPRANGSAAAH
jgi:Carboxypeptidase regulatory-like domain